MFCHCQLNLDLSDLEKLLKEASRPRAKDILTIEIGKLHIEIDKQKKLVAAAVNEAASAAAGDGAPSKESNAATGGSTRITKEMDTYGMFYICNSLTRLATWLPNFLK